LIPNIKRTQKRLHFDQNPIINNPKKSPKTYQYLTDLQREHFLVPKPPQFPQILESSSASTAWLIIFGSIAVWLLSAASKLAPTSKYLDAVFLTRCNNPKPITKTVNINCSNQFRSTVIPPTCIYTCCCLHALIKGFFACFSPFFYM